MLRIIESFVVYPHAVAIVCILISLALYFTILLAIYDTKAAAADSLNSTKLTAFVRRMRSQSQVFDVEPKMADKAQSWFKVGNKAN